MPAGEAAASRVFAPDIATADLDFTPLFLFKQMRGRHTVDDRRGFTGLACRTNHNSALMLADIGYEYLAARQGINIMIN